jgi:hypothetical protein
VHVEIVDLRVGVDTLHLDEDHARQELVLKVCLGDIQRCRRFVLVLITVSTDKTPRVWDAAIGKPGTVPRRATTELRA